MYDRTYYVGGSLPKNAPSYIVRSADRELTNALQKGEFCYVLNSRQIGKSSLLIRTFHQLQAQRNVCVSIDYENQTVYYKYFLTHSEYDKDKWKNDPYF